MMSDAAGAEGKGRVPAVLGLLFLPIYTEHDPVGRL